VTAAVTNTRRYGRHSLVNASDVALYVRKAFGVELKPATIRQWAARKRIATYGHRRERYDLREVVAYAQRQKMIPIKGDTHGPGDRDPTDR
jgi:hypothetical protein